MYLTNKFSSQTILPDSINGKQKQMLKMHYIKKKKKNAIGKGCPLPCKKWITNKAQTKE